MFVPQNLWFVDFWIWIETFHDPMRFNICTPSIHTSSTRKFSTSAIYTEFVPYPDSPNQNLVFWIGTLLFYLCFQCRSFFRSKESYYMIDHLFKILRGPKPVIYFICYYQIRFITLVFVAFIAGEEYFSSSIRQQIFIRSH